MKGNSAHFFSNHSSGQLQLMQGLFTSQKFKPHFHECYTIIIVSDGKGDYLNGSAEYLLSQGSILVLNPYDVHAGQAVKNHPWAFMTMYVPVSTMGAAIPSGDLWDLPVFGKKLIRDSFLYERGMELFDALIHNHEGKTEPMQQFLRRLIVGYATDKKEAEVKNPEIIDVRGYIHDNYPWDVSLKHLSSIAQMADYNLVKSFRNHFQLPPHQYLINLRIERARELITTTSLSLTEVACRVGFFDQSHFIRHFKKIVGVTPTTFSQPYKSVKA